MTFEAVSIGLFTLAYIISNWLVIQAIRSEHKKTRKDQQEIKTRLTQVRKDLNEIEQLTKAKR